MKILNIFLFLFMTHFLSGQGNLQFNQVILVSTVQTVPVGKVWKISSIIPTNAIFYSVNPSSGLTDYIILVNGNIRSVGHLGFRTGASCTGCSFGYSMVLLNEIWLPAGTTLASDAYVGEISIVEFNIIP